MSRNLFLLILFSIIPFVSCNTAMKESDVAMETPTMGWSSWNTYRVHISDSLIMRQADAMVKSGLKNAGYKYINIDDGYFGGRDSETGRLLIHPFRFPNGMKPVVDYIHNLGLKAGIYSDAGRNTCGNYWDNDTIARNVGLFGHDYADAEMFFKEIGFDFIKVDFCGGTTWQNDQALSLDPRSRYEEIKEAIDATGRKDVRLNVCRWDYPGLWVKDIALSWRMSHDIAPYWSSIKDIIAQNLYLSAYAGGGHFNDMDMLEVGRTLSDEEDRTHFGIWCIMSSPLLIGCDLTTLENQTLELLTNHELIALNQDKLCKQAYVVQHIGDSYVLVKDLEVEEGTVRAVALYNPSDDDIMMSLDMEEVSLAGPVRVRDLFAHADMPEVERTLSMSVPAHGCRIFRLEGSQRFERTLYEAETALLSSYQELYNPNVVGSAYYCALNGASGNMIATNIGGSPQNDLVWNDVISHNGGRYEMTLTYVPARGTRLFLSVNGGDGLSLPLEEGGGLCSVSVDVTLNKGANTVRLYCDREMLPQIDCMAIEAQ